MNYTTNSDKPCAFITKAKQRLKQFGQSVYLANNSEFELELFNPTSITVLAKINLNGTPISKSGIVIKPGQRIFLDRFLDDAKKFKFETYEVDLNNKQVQNAITKNGEVSVYFYNEILPIDNYYEISNNTPIKFNRRINLNDTGTGIDWYNHIPTWSYLNTNIGTTTLTMDSFISTSSLNTEKPSKLGILRKQKIETGTVEKGSDSQQTFTYSNKHFTDSTTNASFWKILPESQKPYESADLKVYCTECGTKRKKDSHKFCPNCGTKY